VGLTLAVIGPVAVISPLFMLVQTLAPGRRAAGAIAFQNMTASFGGFVAPAIFGLLREQTGDFTSGMLLLAIGLLISAAIVLALGRVIVERKVRLA
jgi:ACS family tartrate transporter-like MFS transporter